MSNNQSTWFKDSPQPGDKKNALSTCFKQVTMRINEQYLTPIFQNSQLHFLKQVLQYYVLREQV